MGWLLEFFIDLFLEGLLELIVYLYVKIVSWILPEHKFSEKLQKRFRSGILVLFILQMVSFILGLILLDNEEPTFALVGSYMTYIPLGMTALQLTLGILTKVVSIIHRKIRRKSDCL